MVEGQIVCAQALAAVGARIPVSDVDVPTIQGGGALPATLLVLLEAYNGRELPGTGSGLNVRIVVGEDGDSLQENGFDGLKGRTEGSEVRNKEAGKS